MVIPQNHYFISRPQIFAVAHDLCIARPKIFILILAPVVDTKVPFGVKLDCIKMWKLSARKYSIKNLPYESRPTNLYNPVRSAFNIKPKTTEGLIYNPPASAPSLKNTPRAFIPSNDPRLSVLAETYKTYTAEELADMPIIYAHKKEYNLTPEIVKEIIALRQENPVKWSVGQLAKKFNVDIKKINVITGFSKIKQEKALAQLEAAKAKWNEASRRARVDKTRRKQMWLRGEF